MWKISIDIGYKVLIFVRRSISIRWRLILNLQRRCNEILHFLVGAPAPSVIRIIRRIFAWWFWVTFPRPWSRFWRTSSISVVLWSSSFARFSAIFEWLLILLNFQTHNFLISFPFLKLSICRTNFFLSFSFFDLDLDFDSRVWLVGLVSFVLFSSVVFGSTSTRFSGSVSLLNALRSFFFLFFFVSSPRRKRRRFFLASALSRLLINVKPANAPDTLNILPSLSWGIR